jgi:hypothetical protein
MMKKFLLLTLLVAIFAACEKTDPVADLEGDMLKSTELNGEHFNLNLIGVKDKVMDDISGGNVIFVDLYGVTNIMLLPAEEGQSFAVLDKNGTDGEAALQLPEPGLDPYIIGDPGVADTESDYSVWIRPLGKPGGIAEINTMAEVDSINLTDFLKNKEAKDLDAIFALDPDASVTWVWIPQTVTVERKPGKQKFVDVTGELLTVKYEVTVEYDSDGDGILDTSLTFEVRIPIFDDILENEYWEYDNNGLKLLQMRFYPGIPADVTDWDEV